jgi:hypothetical protein
MNLKLYENMANPFDVYFNFNIFLYYFKKPLLKGIYSRRDFLLFKGFPYTISGKLTFLIIFPTK